MQQQRLSDKAATVLFSLRDRQHLDILRGEPDASTQTVQYPNVRSQQLKVSLATRGNIETVGPPQKASGKPEKQLPENQWKS